MIPRRCCTTLLIVFLFAGVFTKTPIIAHATSTGGVLVVNEVRGSECCETGLAKNLEILVNMFASVRANTITLWRYDALNDVAFQKVIREYKLGQNTSMIHGVLVEVTTQLLRDAGVEHVEEVTERNQTQLTRYKPADRKKLLDTLVNKYYSVFNSYPISASSHIIDTDSSLYLKQNYGTTYQFIDSEDQNIDGGPPHYPYPASKNWLFIPDYHHEDPIWVVRKSASDPLYEYGRQVKTPPARSTEQSLTSSISNQPTGQNGFATLLFNNNLKTNETYIRDLVQWLEVNNPKTLLPYDFPFLYGNRTSVFVGSDGDRTAWWITTPVYRYRLIAEGGKVRVTDIRIYGTQLTDPYNKRISLGDALWIAPYLINGARWYDPPKSDHEIFLPPMNDFGHNTTALILPYAQTGSSKYMTNIIEGNTVLIQYTNTQNKEVLLAFAEKNLIAAGFEPGEKKLEYIHFSPPTFPVQDNRFRLSWIWESASVYSMGIDCKLRTCEVEFFTDNISSYNSTRFMHYPHTFPEEVERVVDENMSDIPKNIYLIQNKSHVAALRFRDSFGYVVVKGINVKPNNLTETIRPSTIGNTSYTATYLTAKGKKTIAGTMTTVPDCSALWSTCFASPKYFFSYTFPALGRYLLP